MQLSLVLPCLNEEETIASVIEEALAWMRNTVENGELIVVNDGSTDGTAEVLRALQEKNPELRIVTHEKNMGYGVAVRSGCDAATRDIIAFMDSDGQFRADDISTLLPHLDHYAFVTGKRRRRADPLFRRLYGKVLGMMNALCFGIWVRDINCGMKAFRRSIWSTIRPEHGVEKLFNTEVFLRLKRSGIAWHQVDVPHYPRLHGQPTGAKPYVILRMFRELMELKREVR